MTTLELTTMLANKLEATIKHDWRTVNEIDRKLAAMQEARRLAPFAEYLEKMGGDDCRDGGVR